MNNAESIIANLSNGHIKGATVTVACQVTTVWCVTFDRPVFAGQTSLTTWFVDGQISTKSEAGALAKSLGGTVAAI